MCGVDGCRIGWFYFELNEVDYEFGVYSTFRDLLYQVSASSKILVDIPIGLPSVKETQRECDVEARKLLGSRRSSVFQAPIREILKSKTHDEANFISKQLTGKGLSRQTFNIIPKINEVDQMLRADVHKNKVIREAHPELCFLSLAKGSPMKYNKKTQQGFEERLQILKKYWKPSEQAIAKALLGFQRRAVARDDIVDALCLAIIASHPDADLRSIPQNPPSDQYGLTMEMVFLSFSL